jgi:hypothetical protein
MKTLLIGFGLGVLLIVAIAADFSSRSFIGDGSSLTNLSQVANLNPWTNAAFGVSNASFANGMSLGTNGNLSVQFTVTASSFVGSGSGLSAGTVPNQALVTQAFTNWDTVAPYLFQLGVSNNATTVGLGATNVFEVRATNTAAIPPAFSVGTNGNAYATKATIGTNYTFVAWLATNALSSWPTAPRNNGDAALVSSNGTVYLLTSTNAAAGSATWTWTNRVGPQ